MKNASGRFSENVLYINNHFSDFSSFFDRPRRSVSREERKLGVKYKYSVEYTQTAWIFLNWLLLSWETDVAAERYQADERGHI